MESLTRTSALLVAVLLLAAVRLGGQHFGFEHFGLGAGLANLSVRDIALDHKGLIWVATGNGVYRFDGHRFTRFGVDKGLAQDTVHAVVVGPDGSVFAGTSMGISASRGQSFQQLAVADGRDLIGCIGSGCLGVLPDGRLVVASARGLAVLEKGALRVMKGTENWGLPSVGLDSAGGIWASSRKRVYHGSLIPGGDVEWDDAANAWGLPENEYSGVVVDGQKRTWVRSRRGLFMLAPGEKTFRLTDLPVPAVGRLTGLSVDAAGELWVPTYAGLWHRTDGRWVRFGAANGLHADPVTAIRWDKFGTPWVGMQAHGLARWNGYPAWRSWQKSDGLSTNEVTAFARDSRGRMWIGTKGGLNRMDPGGGFTVLQTRQGLAADDVRALVATPDGAIWAGSNEGGLNRIAANGSIRRFGIADGLGSTRIVSITVEDSGNIWLCTRAGIYLGD